MTDGPKWNVWTAEGSAPCDSCDGIVIILRKITPDGWLRERRQCLTCGTVSERTIGDRRATA